MKDTLRIKSVIYRPVLVKPAKQKVEKRARRVSRCFFFFAPPAAHVSLSHSSFEDNRILIFPDFIAERRTIHKAKRQL
jgi:hypothetical protein